MLPAHSACTGGVAALHVLIAPCPPAPSRPPPPAPRPPAAGVNNALAAAVTQLRELGAVSVGLRAAGAAAYVPPLSAARPGAPSEGAAALAQLHRHWDAVEHILQGLPSGTDTSVLRCVRRAGGRWPRAGGCRPPPVLGVSTHPFPLPSLPPRPRRTYAVAAYNDS
jgi:hypothetical protein